MAQPVQARSVWKDYGLAIGIAVVVAFLIRVFLIEAYRIPSEAMKPTLLPGDTIFVSKWAYGFRLPLMKDPLTGARAPQRGEVVLFSPETEPGRDYLKRVIGLPGDTVEVRQGRVVLNGRPLAVKVTGDDCGTETLPEGNHGICLAPPLIGSFGPEKVPANSVFVLGDSRTDTSIAAGGDRKKPKGWGIFPVSSLRGQALWVWLSIQPRTGTEKRWLPQFRSERMFRRIE